MQTTATATSVISRRKAQADGVPFILRSWWMRDFVEEIEQQFFEDPTLLSLPIWSLHSDPKCDSGGVDYELF
ncbi:MAG TPA: hypothetical protein V6C81_01830 [Planktothrix sp.]|jgi:hypothetical protein